MNIFSRKLFIALTLISLSFFVSSASAELNLVLNKGMSAQIPIAVVPFATQQNNLNAPNNIASIISNDLSNSGHFKVMPFGSLPGEPLSLSAIDFNTWKQTGNDYMVIGQVKPLGNNQTEISFSLVNVVTGSSSASAANTTVLLSNQFQASAAQYRYVAHKISDMIYKTLIGIRGAFNTKVAYVLIKRPPHVLPEYYLTVADADGYNPRTLVRSNEPLMSPSWSPDGQRIAYVSLANNKAAIYVVDLANGQQRMVSDFEGINGAPAWSADGKQLAIVLSKTGQPKIYLYTLATGSLKQETFGMSIDTEPDFSPDGSSIIFTSNRDGGPQIYQLSLATGAVSRVTFSGNYNARATFINQGKDIVMLHQDSGGYNIAVQNLASGNMTILTSTAYDSSPSPAPNGQLIIYSNDSSINGALQVVSGNGKVQWTFPTGNQGENTVLEPAWSPYFG